MTEPTDRPPERPHVAIRFSAAEIATRVDEMAADLAVQLPADTLVVSVLKGSFVFAADLIRALSRAGANWSMDFLTLSSYGTGTKTSGNVRIVRDIVDDVRGRDVLLVDDILDTGKTMTRVLAKLRLLKPRRIKTCVLLNKAARRVEKIEADYVGFEIPDHFVVGYGLDFAERYRNLPFVGILRPDIYESIATLSEK